MKAARKTAHRGRPREFDPERALDAAMRVFWQYGYEGTSLPALTRAMGINRPSLYAAFGNKEQLFRRALDRYTEQAGCMMNAALNQPTARGVVESLFRAAVAPCAKTDEGRGCMLVQSALACSKESSRIRNDVLNRRRAVESLLRQRFDRARAENDLPPGANPATLAKYVVTFQHGLAVQLASGADRGELRAAVEVALKAWPTAT